MDPIEMVVAIVFLVVVGGIVKALIHSRAERKGSGEEALREADELREQILTLEDRIRVLERIVTDGTSNSREDLRRQFRELER